MRYDAIPAVRACTASVNFSGAGPPLPQLYLTPKSSVGPPGLWDAVSRKAPAAAPRSRVRSTALIAGVAMRPPTPTQTLATPCAAAMRTMMSMASAE